MTTLDEFLEATASRIPTVAEMLALCDALGITFGVRDGQPVLRTKSGSKAEAIVLAKLFRREPFRSQIVAAKLGVKDGVQLVQNGAAQ